MKYILAFGVLLLVTAIQAAELECYVCNDCETGYEVTKKTCSGSGSGSGSGDGSGSGSGDGSGSGSGDGSGSGSGSGDGSDSGSGDGSGSGSGSGDGSGSGSGSGDGSGSGSGSGDGSGSGSGSGDGSGSGSGSGDGSGSGSGSGDGKKIENFSSSGRGGGNGFKTDEIPNLRNAHRLENTDYYSVQMADSSGDNTVSQKAQIKFARSIRNDDILNTKCVVTSYEENNTIITKRGCSYLNLNDTQRCHFLIDVNHTGTLKRCSVCEGNLCNTAYRAFGTLHFQFAFIITIISVYFST